MPHFPLARILATTAASWLLVSGAYAQVPAGRSRAEVEAEAVAAARAPNQNVTRGSRGAETFNSVADPERMRQQAIDAAHAPNQNVTSGSRVNSKVISTMPRRSTTDSGATAAK